MKSNLKLKKGQMLIIGILFLAIILIFSTTIFTKVRYFINFGTNATLKEQARHVAEAGIDYAIRKVKTTPGYTGEPNVPVGSSGSVSIVVTNPNAVTKRVQVTSNVPATNPKAHQKAQIDLQPSIADISFMTNNTHFMSAAINTNGPNKYIYLLGGDEAAGGNPSDRVRYAKIKTSPPFLPEEEHTLEMLPPSPPDYPYGIWKETTQKLPTRAILPGAFAQDGYLYNLGGQNSGSTNTNQIFYQKPDADGDIVAWTVNLPSLPAELNDFGAFFSNNHVYIVGGDEGGSYVNTDRSAAWNPATHEIEGPWIVGSPNAPMPSTRQAAAYAQFRDYIYVIGGNTTDTVYIGHINPTLNIVDTFVNSSIGLPSNVGLTFARATVVDTVIDGTAITRLYVLGGRNGIGGTSVEINDIYCVDLNPDGSLAGNFNKDAAGLPLARSTGVALSDDKYLYYIGGYSAAKHKARGNTWLAHVDTSKPYGPNSCQLSDWTDNGNLLGISDISSWKKKPGSYIVK